MIFNFKCGTNVTFLEEDYRSSRFYNSEEELVLEDGGEYVIPLPFEYRRYFFDEKYYGGASNHIESIFFWEFLGVEERIIPPTVKYLTNYISESDAEHHSTELTVGMINSLHQFRNLKEYPLLVKIAIFYSDYIGDIKLTRRMCCYESMLEIMSNPTYQKLMRYIDANGVFANDCMNFYYNNLSSSYTFPGKEIEKYFNFYDTIVSIYSESKILYNICINMMEWVFFENSESEKVTFLLDNFLKFFKFSIKNKCLLTIYNADLAVSFLREYIISLKNENKEKFVEFVSMIYTIYTFEDRNLVLVYHSSLLIRELLKIEEILPELERIFPGWSDTIEDTEEEPHPYQNLVNVLAGIFGGIPPPEDVD